MAPTVVTLFYPVSTTKPFDQNYYTSNHMPTVQKKWGDKGMTSWFVVRVDPSSGYDIQCTMVWESQEKLQAAMAGPDAAEITADIQNYTDTKPVSYVGGEIARS